eukprot:COSAG01_NODE_351_length_18449_cov_34.646886_16_plen_168_part_00
MHHYSPDKAQQLKNAAPTGRQSFNGIANLLRGAVGIRTENLREITERSDVLERNQGLLLCQLVDQNGTRGHAVVVDTDRGVIIDPAEKNEMQLTKFNLNRSCGVASMCIGVTESELDKYNIPATVQKYFGPRGLLTALLLRTSLASIASGTSTPVTATGTLHDVSSI